MSDLRSLYAGLGSAEMSERGVPLGPIKVKNEKGEVVSQLEACYKLQINKLQMKRTNTKGVAFIAECTVLESDNISDHPVGCKRTWFQKMDGDSAKVGPGALKGFILAALQIHKDDQAKVDAAAPGLADVVDQAIGDKQALKGQCVDVRVLPAIKTKGGKDFSLHMFLPGNPKA